MKPRTHARSVRALYVLCAATCSDAFCSCRYSIFGIVHRVRANKIEVPVLTVINFQHINHHYAIAGPSLKHIWPSYS
jgi:hypothetical protein